MAELANRVTGLEYQVSGCGCVFVWGGVGGGSHTVGGWGEEVIMGIETDD